MPHLNIRNTEILSNQQGHPCHLYLSFYTNSCLIQISLYSQILNECFRFFRRKMVVRQDGRSVSQDDYWPAFLYRGTNLLTSGNHLQTNGRCTRQIHIQLRFNVSTKKRKGFSGPRTTGWRKSYPEYSPWFWNLDTNEKDELEISSDLLLAYVQELSLPDPPAPH